MSQHAPEKNALDPIELQRLLSAWSDDSLSDDEFARLDEIIRTSSAARQVYAQYVNLCEHLGELVVPQARLEGAASVQSAPASGSSIKHQRVKSRVARWLVVCVALLAVTTVGVYSWVQTLPRNDLAALNGIPDINTAAAFHIAVITDVDKPVWEAGTAPVGIGSALGLQTLSLVSGSVELDFADGAKVSLRGPAEFSLLSESRARLGYGELSALVPERAEGFIIDTPHVEVVDLGTEFGVSVNRAGVADVHVFRGAIETRQNGVNETPGSLLRMEASETCRFSPDTPNPLKVQFQPAVYPRLQEPAAHDPQTRGAVCLLRQAPESVAPETLESNDFILLFEERANVVLDKPLAVNMSEPGRYADFRGKQRRLPAGTRVTSYLLHFDSTELQGHPQQLRLDGSVTFPHPILGVIARGKQIINTDSFLGHPETAYSDIKARGLDSKTRGDTQDIVTLSEDRRTLDISFSVRRSSDQLRVLIAAPAPAGPVPADNAEKDVPGI